VYVRRVTAEPLRPAGTPAVLSIRVRTLAILAVVAVIATALVLAVRWVNRVEPIVIAGAA
jgi:hypothetical protein